MPNVEQLVLGVDPGLAATGYGVISINEDAYRYVADGTIRTDSHLPISERLQKIYDALHAVLTTHKPTVVGMESLYFAKNATSAIPVAQARGAILLLFAQHALHVNEFNPLHIKQLITDYGRASKEQMRTMVRTLLAHSLSHRISNHAVDGLAIALCCCYSKNVQYAP